MQVVSCGGDINAGRILWCACVYDNVTPLWGFQVKAVS